MTKKNWVIPLCVLILVTMACSFGYEGVVFSDDPEIDHILDITATAESYSQSSAPIQVEATPEPAPKTDVPQNEVTQPESGEINEYSVSATNFTCTCVVDGNVTVQFTIEGDQLEFNNSAGGSDVYEKIGENRYKRSWMGYYILTSGEGDNMTETKVDEEQSTVIILNNDGYVMEHYKGSDDSPCCYHTFKITK
jgi:hypothetical protein